MPEPEPELEPQPKRQKKATAAASASAAEREEPKRQKKMAASPEPELAGGRGRGPSKVHVDVVAAALVLADELTDDSSGSLSGVREALRAIRVGEDGMAASVRLNAAILGVVSETASATASDDDKLLRKVVSFRFRLRS